MVLRGRPRGRVGHRRTSFRKAHQPRAGGLFACPGTSGARVAPNREAGEPDRSPARRRGHRSTWAARAPERSTGRVCKPRPLLSASWRGAPRRAQTAVGRAPANRGRPGDSLRRGRPRSSPGVVPRRLEQGVRSGRHARVAPRAGAWQDIQVPHSGWTAESGPPDHCQVVHDPRIGPRAAEQLGAPVPRPTGRGGACGDPLRTRSARVGLVRADEVPAPKAEQRCGSCCVPG
jgi:hypothetical protein